MQTTTFEVEPRQRRWPTPPPLTRGSDETIGGLMVLEEFPDPVASPLWHSFRGLMLWATAPAQLRDQLFLPDTDGKRSAELRAGFVPGALQTPLRVIADLFDAITQPTTEALADACRTVSEWAEEQGKLGTALAFMQAAALVLSSDGRAAYLTGRLARRRAEYARAESWFYEAISRALESRDWSTYALAFIGLGNLHLQRGNLPAGRRCHTRALRIAHKHGLKEAQGMAAHDLFVVADLGGRIPDAERYAAEALRGYGANHPRLPHLANDVACSWMGRGEFRRALPVFRAVFPHIHQRRDRLLILSCIARTCGALHDEQGFAEAWSEAWALLTESSAAEGLPQALFNLASGAASLGRWEQAGRAAARGYEIALQRREAEVRFSLEALIQAVESEQRSEAPRPQLPTSQGESLDPLASKFVDLLMSKASA